MNKIIEWRYRHHLLALNQVFVLQQPKNLLKLYLHLEKHQITPYHKVFV